jgi:CheY-like chemotaxis protein
MSYRILLAEDDETTVFSISRLLEKSGYSVTVAHNGQEALEIHETNDFDIILMDVSDAGHGWHRSLPAHSKF